MKEVSLVDSKGSGPEEALGNPGRFGGSEGLKAGGNRQGSTENTTSDGGSNLESLRQGGKPQPEAVIQRIKEDPACRNRALKAWQASNGDTYDGRLENIHLEEEKM